MKPIIDPWFFYAIGVVDAVNLLLISTVVVTLLVVAARCLERSTNDEKVIVTRGMKAQLWLVILLSVVCCFIPSSDTLIKMKVAEKLTPDMIESLKDEGKSVMLFLTEQIKDVMEGEK